MPARHKTLYEYLQGVDIDSCTARSGKKNHKRIFNDRWMNEVPRSRRQGCAARQLA